LQHEFRLSPSHKSAKLRGPIRWHGGFELFHRWIHFSCRVALVAAILAPIFAAIGGCALWKAETWNLNNYRDDRAVDIDRRLDKTGPIVNNPF
jgi:hypothetical protein